MPRTAKLFLRNFECAFCVSLGHHCSIKYKNNKVYKASRIFFSSLTLKLDAANSIMFVKLAELIRPHTLKLDASNLTMFVKLAELSVTLKLD